MEMNPQRVRTAEFKTVRKGADPDEVRSFLSDVADELERAQNQSTAMEARARAAVSRLQELSESDQRPAATAPADVEAAPAEPAKIEASVDESETISRTLLLAQRTADTAVAEARAEAERTVAEANDEAAKTLDSTREMSAKMLQEARDEARRVGDAERLAIAGEVDALKARRDFLESDVDQLETFLVEQRSRVREAATSLIDVADRVPGGLGDTRRPLLSASDDENESADDVIATSDSTDDDDDLVIVTGLAEETEIDSNADTERTETDEDTVADDGTFADEDTFADDGAIDPATDVTTSLPITPADGNATPTSTGDDSDGFRFSFDDDRT